MGCCYAESMPFFVSAESGVDPISEPRQTEPAAIGLALDYIDRGASFFEDFRLAYSAIPRAKK